MSTILVTANYYKQFVKSLFFCKSILKKKKHVKTILIRNVNQAANHNVEEKDVNIHKNYVPFNDMVKLRKDEADRSILVQVQSSKSVKELYSYCAPLGNIKHMFHYIVGLDPMHFILIEFASETDVKSVLNKSSHFSETQVIPVNSSFLWFRTSNGRKAAKNENKSFNLEIENGSSCLLESEIVKKLQECESISDQMSTLYNITKLNDVGTRLRFLTAHQVEQSISGMFPNAKAFPFGSSVNGFGKMGCDLDLVLRLYDGEIDESSRLVFHAKESSGSERSMAQRNMKTIGDVLQLFLPGCGQVRSILQARVPIIKYYQQFTGVECDLSMSNMSGFHMSDFLYLMGSIDERVKPLVYAVRKWASAVGLTNPSPGRWITNFSLTLLVLAYLQKETHNRPSILPSLNKLITLARSCDKYVTEDGINCTFLRDINKLPRSNNSEINLETLLKGFFEFYSQFDFTTKAVCLNEAVSITKPEHNPLYIVNPLERGLNVSKNVSLEELERFKYEIRNAAWLLDSEVHDTKTQNWGLLNIFESKRTPSKLNFVMSKMKHTRLMDVTALFNEETIQNVKENEAIKNVDSLGESGNISEDSSKFEIKNENIKKQVENIKRETRERLQKIQKLQDSNR